VATSTRLIASSAWMRRAFGVMSLHPGPITSVIGTQSFFFFFHARFGYLWQQGESFGNIHLGSFHPDSFMLMSSFRGDPVVREIGDAYRDTVALTVRGDGVDIPPYFILHSYQNAALSSGRRCPRDQTPVKGMTSALMKGYIDHVVQYVQEPSLFIMDRLSSHKAGEVLRYIRSKLTSTGEQLLIPILLAPKTAFLISPLDMGAIAAFKSHFYKLDRSTLDRKKKALSHAWDQVSNDSLRNIYLNCGITGEETLDSLRHRFMSNVVGAVPAELEEVLDYYDSWASGAIDVDGASRGRGVTMETPQQLPEAQLSGRYWTRFGWTRP
jgi:hypothetical protein